MKHSFSPEISGESAGDKECSRAFRTSSHAAFRDAIVGWRVMYCEFPLRSLRLKVLIELFASEFSSTVAPQVLYGTAAMIKDLRFVFLVSFEGFAFLGDEVDVDLSSSVILVYSR